jgi:hypothetical protein
MEEIIISFYPMDYIAFRWCCRLMLYMLQELREEPQHFSRSFVVEEVFPNR